MKKPELLSPAGSLEKVKWAIDYGADAVFIGGVNFSLRANAGNLTNQEIKRAVKYAHKFNKKLYVALNIVFHNIDFKNLDNYLLELDSYNVDALIVSDIAVIKRIKQIIPNMKIHLSTQASVYNYMAAIYYESIGVKRVVLARECSKDDIKQIIDKTNLEVEVFIHGAMCSGFSGRCILSNALTSRDANHGGCSQVCRFDFDLYNKKTKIEGKVPFTIAAKDLSMGKYIHELIELGVTSLKIEGRMRSIYYIATITNTYRNIIDDYMNQLSKFTYNEKYDLILSKCANRETTDQFYNFDQGEHASYFENNNEISNQEFLAIVKSYDKLTNIATLEQRNHFTNGIKATVFGPNTKPFNFTISELTNEDNIPLVAAKHPLETVKIKLNHPVKPNDIIRINYS